MAELDNIVIDPQAELAFSAEEQNEILSKINRITEKNKQKLSEDAGDTEKSVKEIAKKKGVFFPLIVNITAIVILCAGFFLLISFNVKADTQHRKGNAVYNTTERALIEEIRKETQDQIAAKEKEITSIASRLSAVDDELMQLLSSNISLSEEQIAARERLTLMQSAFRQELGLLQEERSNILEASRTREARLRSQLEERSREFAVAQERVSGELETAMSELERLTKEQDRNSAIDAQLAGGIASIGELIQKEQYDLANQSIASLRIFLNNNTSRSFQTRREYYNQAMNLMEVMIEKTRKNSGTGNPEQQHDLLTRNSELQAKVNDLQKSIDALSSGSTGQAGRISELEQAISALRTTNTSLEQSSSEKDRTISSLRTENNSLSSNANELRTSNTALEQRIVDLENQLRAIRQLLQDN
ncbi:MAG: hypothetical protein FWB86_00960 [Treponema sp.]|nr:hypothetical protein [Treponema sp.]MCL2250668.1 hypothetical protein [Treponema sp.]